ncbi:hypothetical protein C5167_030712 [Papaver somniferum]|nr:hypothetical protein C5167_030712 [Papaver somniferum]
MSQLRTMKKCNKLKGPTLLLLMHRIKILVWLSHMKQMKPDNIEGFNFSLRNIVCCSPAGCILAHAPGSGKTLIISFIMQNFLDEYPNAIPLCSVVQRNLGYLEEGV